MKQELWFKRKRFGWGWTPANYKGWLVVAVYMILATASTLISYHSMPAFFLALAILTIVFFWVCFKKGEKPKWSWGDDGKSE